MSFPCSCALCLKDLFGLLRRVQCTVCGIPMCEKCCVRGSEKAPLCKHHAALVDTPPGVIRSVSVPKKGRLDLQVMIEQANEIREQMDRRVSKGEWPIDEMRDLVTLGFPIPDNVLESLVAHAVQGCRLIRGTALPLVVEFLPEYLKSEKWRSRIKELLEKARDHTELWSPNKEDQDYYWVADYGLKKLSILMEALDE